MEEAQQSTIMQGEYGRVTLNLTARPLVEHAHSEYNCIFKLVGGDTPFRVLGKQHLLTDNTAILVNPWEPHAKLASIETPTLVLTLLLHAAWFASSLGITSARRVRLFPTTLVTLTPEIAEQARRLAVSMMAGVETTDEEREPLLRDLVRAVLSQYTDQAFAHESLMAERPMDARIVRAIRLLRGNAAQNPSLEDVASQVGLSRSRFFEQFKNCVGASPQQYLDWERMALATRMLADPQVSVAAVSDELGFSAQSHFARFFAQHIGLPPSDFKRGMVSVGPA